MFEKILAIIPARGGSKTIKNKNIISFINQPLIYHSIKVAKESKYINKIIVSSDSDKIMKIAKISGAEVPFKRPKRFATDKANDFVVFKHCIDWLRDNQGYVPDLIIHLRPTYPLRSNDIIDDNILKAFENQNFDSMRSVCEPFQNPYKMWIINNKTMTPLIKSLNIDESYNCPRQSLNKVFWQNGCLDIIKPKTILELNSISGKNILPIYMKPEEIFDIDDQFSLDLLNGYINYKVDV